MRSTVSRRDVLAIVAWAALPGLLRAQPADKPARIGMLISGDRERALAWMQAFREALRNLGYASGRPLGLELRFADRQLERLPALADELAKRDIKAIVVADDASLAAAKGTATQIPIVAASVLNPVELAPKQLELLRAFLPKLSRVALLMNPDNTTHRAVFTSLGAAAQAKAIRVLGVEAQLADEIGAAFDAMRGNRVGAALIAPDGLFSQEIEQVAEHAVRRRLPTVAALAGYAEAGGLVTYGEEAAASYRRAAAAVDDILTGAKRMKGERSSKIPLVVNRRTAKIIGLTVPQRVLKAADRVIG